VGYVTDDEDQTPARIGVNTDRLRRAAEPPRAQVHEQRVDGGRVRSCGAQHMPTGTHDGTSVRDTAQQLSLRHDRKDPSSTPHPWCLIRVGPFRT
jgi:hypothetical protein